MQEPGKPARRHQLKAGEIVYGRWAQGAHCNEKMPASVVGGPLKGHRRTWTLYVDYRVLASNFALIHNKGLELYRYIVHNYSHHCGCQVKIRINDGNLVLLRHWLVPWEFTWCSS